MRVSGKLRRKIWKLGGEVGDKYNQSILYGILKELTKFVARGREIYPTDQRGMYVYSLQVGSRVAGSIIQRLLCMHSLQVKEMAVSCIIRRCITQPK